MLELFVAVALLLAVLLIPLMVLARVVAVAATETETDQALAMRSTRRVRGLRRAIEWQNGAVLSCADGTLYQVMYGRRRLVDTQALFESLTRSRHAVTRVDAATCAAVPLGAPLSLEGALVTQARDPEPRFWLVVEGVRREMPMVEARAFISRGARFVTVDRDVVAFWDALPEGLSLATEGALVRAPDQPEIYWIQGGAKRWVPDPQYILRAGRSGQEFLVSGAKLAAMPTGDVVGSSELLQRAPLDWKSIALAPFSWL
jgi:hypothetical protein